jgi:hypothetical protein
VALQLHLQLLTAHLEGAPGSLDNKKVEDAIFV